MSRIFGEIRQNGYVVRDVEAAMAHWTKVLGVGPFFYFPRVVVLDSVYRGKPEPLELAVALSNSGPLQIELMRQLNDAPSALRDFAESTGEGLHHVAYWTESFDETMTKIEALGYEVWHSGAIGSADNRFAYLSTQSHAGSVVEISELSGMKGQLFKFIADAARSWDGTDPIRTF